MPQVSTFGTADFSAGRRKTCVIGSVPGFALRTGDDHGAAFYPKMTQAPVRRKKRTAPKTIFEPCGESIVFDQALAAR
jgi:hypothetical protein